MRKPSIFSRDYERQIRKRKRIITIISIIAFVVVAVLIVKFTTKTFNFTGVRAKIQKWVDEDTSENKIADEVPNIESTSEAPIEPIVPKAKIMELKITEGKILKVEYEELEGVIKFKEAKEIPEGIEYNISPSKELVVVTDDKQNIKVINTKGEEKNITKDSYVSPKGEIFKKDIVQSTYKDYLWHKSAKFINDKKIVYKTNMPYFGSGLNQYLWLIDIDGKNEITVWQSKGKDIIIGNIKEKGIEVTIDGNMKYINNDNNLVN